MPLPLYFHIGNSGGLSFVRAVGAASSAGARDDVLEVNTQAELERERRKLTPEGLAKLIFGYGHAIHLAEPYVSERYDMTILRWPQGVLSANALYAHENPSNTIIPEVFAAPDHAARLRRYLDHLDAGGLAALWTVPHWMRFRHKVDCGDYPGPQEARRVAEDCDALLRDRYRLVGITELLDETLFLYHADHPGAPLRPWVRIRVNKKAIDHANLPSDIAERFRDAFATDFMLYERARARLLARFTQLWRERPDLHRVYLDYKTAMVLTDPILMTRLAEGDPLYFPPELPLDAIREAVMAQIPRATEIRQRVLAACA